MQLETILAAKKDEAVQDREREAALRERSEQNSQGTIEKREVGSQASKGGTRGSQEEIQ